MNLRFNNKTIHYQLKGSGQCIVLLHGFLESLNIWHYFSDKLSHKFKVVSIDLPGFGKTENFSESHSMEFMADVVKAVLDHEQIEDCVMLGHSMGGYTSLAFANKYPKMLKGFCLFNSQAAADSKEVKINRDRTIEVIQKDRLGFIQEFIPDLFAEVNREKFKIQIEEQKQNASQTSKDGIVAALLGMKEREDSLNLLKSMKIPVLFIAGKQDKRILVSTILEQAALPFHSELLLLEDVGHMAFIEARDKTLNTVDGFATRCF